MSTIIRQAKILPITAVDATPLDGTTAGRTYQSGSFVTTYAVPLDAETDAVIISISGTGSDGNTVAFHIYGAGIGSPIERIYHTVTATLGTGVAGTGQLFADTISGTDVHTSTVGVYDSGNNTVCKIKFDTQGLRCLYFEPITFTTLTAVKFIVREVGQE